MAARILLDLSRLVYAAWKRTPSGIPRVELAYAEHFIASAQDRLSFTVLDAWGRLGVVDGRRARAFVAAIASYWRSEIASPGAHLRLMLRAAHIYVLLFLQPHGALRRAIRRQPGRWLYVIVSQLNLDRPKRFERLKAAGDVRMVCYVHDILPCLYPEYFPPGSDLLARRKIDTMLRLADALLVLSQATADSLRGFVAGAPPPRVIVAWPGLHLAPRSAAPAEPAGPPYFVMIGTIEPRKNHLFILNLWRALRAERGPTAPRLLVIGGRGWEIENVIDMFERSIGLREVVTEVGTASDEEVERLLLGARALLMPSFAEGFGLPLAEALALGVPALCSDIPPFREIGGDVPEYLDPLDGPGWREAVLAYAGPGAPRRAAQLDRLAGWTAPSWTAHFRQVDGLLASLESPTADPASGGSAR